MELTHILRRAGISGAELARRLGVSQNSVSKWKRSGVPRYALAYLELLIEYNRVRP